MSENIIARSHRGSTRHVAHIRERHAVSKELIDARGTMSTGLAGWISWDVTANSTHRHRTYTGRQWLKTVPAMPGGSGIPCPLSWVRSTNRQSRCWIIPTLLRRQNSWRPCLNGWCGWSTLFLFPWCTAGWILCNHRRWCRRTHPCCSKQGMWVEPRSYLARQGLRWWTCSLRNDTFQQIVTWGRGLLSISMAEITPILKKKHARRIQSTQLPTDIWPPVPLEAARTHRQRTVTGSPWYESSLARASVGLSSFAFHRDSSSKSNVRCATCCWSWYGNVTRHVGPQCRFWLCGPRHSDASTEDFIRYNWGGARMDHFLPHRLITIRAIQRIEVQSRVNCMRCATGIGPWPTVLYPVYLGCLRAHNTTRLLDSRLRGQPPDLRPLLRSRHPNPRSSIYQLLWLRWIVDDL